MDAPIPVPARDMPAQIGRFAVLSQIGAGGMGVVYAAYDPELDRKVAVKLLHPNLSGSEREDVGRARLLREAQAMARLSHPNVVAVYDVGTHDEQVFIAMEFIHGVALSVWLRLAPRTWRDVVAVLRDAGRGLAAAHAQGLVHGDFKPDNVLVDRDGRTRVVDFGLAFDRDRDPAVPATDRDALRSGITVGLDTRLTRSGALTGTPAYCAPEQFRGGPGSPLADQFSFAVSLHEALYGVRPFPGDDINALARAICLGQPIPEPPGARVPTWLRRVVLRGLDVDPTRRYPDIPALLTALGRDPSRVRRRWAAVLAALVVLLAAAWLYRWTVLRAYEQRQGLCAGAADDLVGVWDPVRKDSIRKAMRATGLAYADDTATRVAARLDDYTAAWAAMHADACQATHLRGEQSPALLDLRMACLRRHRNDVRSLVDVLAEADADVVERAGEAVAGLPVLDACADVAALQGRAPRVHSPAADAVHERLADARAELRTARLADALASARSAVAGARRLADPALIAEAMLVEGMILDERGETEAADALADAFFTAEATGDVRLLLETSVHLVFDAAERSDLPAARQWARHAAALLARARGERPTDADALEIPVLNARGNLAVREGRLDLAEQHYTDALARAAAGASKFTIAGVHNNLGNMLARRGDLVGAEDHLRASLAIYRAELGDHHPNLAIALNNLAEVHMRRGAWDEAEAQYRQAHAILLAVLGASHPNLGVVDNNLGDVLQRRSLRDEARGHYGRARAIFEAALGPEHPALAYPLTGLGELLIDAGDPATAVPLLTRALPLRDPGDPTNLARTRFALARAGDPRAAALAAEAREAYAAAGPAFARELAEVDAWRRLHP